MVGLVERRGRAWTKNICVSHTDMKTVWELTVRRGNWGEGDKWEKIGTIVIASTIKKYLTSGFETLGHTAFSKISATHSPQ